MFRLNKKIGIFFLITIVFLLLFFLGIQKIHCYDAWGHIAIGKYIIENGRLLFNDVFSYTAEGKFFYNFSWGYQILFYLLYVFGKLPALIIFKTLVIVCSFLLLFWSGYKKTPVVFLLFMLLLAILNARVRFFLRPEIFTFLFLSFYLFSLSKYFENNRKWIYFLPVVQLLWVNMHSMSMLGFSILFMYAMGEYIIKKVTLPFDWNEYGYLKVKEIKLLFLMTGICVLVTLINPYGYKVFIHYLDLFNILSANSNILPCGIQELRPIPLNFASFLNTDIIYFKLLILISSLSILFNIKRQHISTLLIFLIFLFFAKISRRNVGVFSIVAFFVTCQNVNVLLNKSKFRLFRKDKFYQIFNFILIIAILFMCFSNFKNVYDLDGYIDGKIIKRSGIGDNPLFPKNAFNFIKENDIKGNMFNSFNFGHYLIWRGYPERKVFIDGRTGVYQEDILRFYANSFLFKNSVKNIIDKYNINYFLLNPVSGGRFLNKFLYENKDWELIYFSPFSVIYIKGDDKNKDIIEKNNVDFKKWLEKFERFKKINKEYYGKVAPEFMSLVNEGIYFKNIGKLKYSELAFKESIKLNPYFLDSYLQLTDVYITGDKYKLAVNLLEGALRKGLVSKMIYTNLGYSYEKIGNIDKAIDLYRKATTNWGEIPSVEAYYNLARIYYEKGLYRKGLIKINKAIKFKPNSYINHYTKGNIYISMGLYDKASGPLEKSINLNPSFAPAYNNLGLCYYELGFKERAYQMFQRALELDPSLKKKF